MILTNDFLVEASIDRVWRLFDELENVIPCMPGGAYLGQDGEDKKVSIKMKVGVVSSHFQGAVRFVEKNESTHTAKIRGTGKDLGGKASAVATIVAKLEKLSPDRTHVIVETDLAMTGRLAQFGSGVIADIASRMISQFTDNLHKAIISQSSVAAPTESAMAVTPDLESATATIPRKELAALDLGAVMRPIALKWALKYLLLPAGFFVLGWLVGRFF